MSLGGSVFAHNAVQFDYCLAESIASLCGVCDEVVALDAESTDDTIEVLKQCALRHNNLKVVLGAKWDCAKNYDRLAILANKAKSYLKTDWHFMLQADEVLHEDSFPHIRNCIQNRKDFRSFFCRRINLFGDLNHYLRFDLPQDRKPCSDVVIRLAKTEYPAVGDAESIGVDPAYINTTRTDNIQIFHYGMVRRDPNFIEKVINMQSWFFGDGSQPDQRVVAMKDSGVPIFDWKVMKERSDLARIPWSHPMFSKEWAEERQREKTPVE